MQSIKGSKDKMLFAAVKVKIYSRMSFKIVLMQILKREGKRLHVKTINPMMNKRTVNQPRFLSPLFSTQHKRKLFKKNISCVFY